MIAMQIKVPPITQLPLPSHVTLSPTGIVYAVLASALLAGGLIIFLGRAAPEAAATGFGSAFQ